MALPKSSEVWRKTLEKAEKAEKALALLWRRYAIAAVVAACAVVAYALFSLAVPRPAVAVIEVAWPIYSEDVRDYVELFKQARGDPAVRAIVLEIDSPGGEAAAIEELYMQVLELRKAKPVVTSIASLAASGAYYIAIASNYVYAKPSSEVGGVGVISMLPEPVEIEEEVITTGPFKQTAYSRKEYAYQVQSIQDSFLKAVSFQRHGKLKISLEEIARAKLYTGMQAVSFGLIDEIGSSEDAVKRAAFLAGIANYEVKRLTPELELFLLVIIGENESAQKIFLKNLSLKKAFELLSQGSSNASIAGVFSHKKNFFVDKGLLRQTSNTAPTHYYLYLHQSPKGEGSREGGEESGSGEEGDVR